jgi:Asp-tRNA(Asn)/Glu-tRNA(Gln) amidotransferase A subunit family amidase
MFTGKDTFKSVNGPLARTVDDLALWMKIALNEKHQVERDPYLRLIPFDEKIYLQHQKERKLKIGYYLS